MDAPVGNNLQDHIFLDSQVCEINEPIGITTEKAKSVSSILDYYIFGQGW